MPRSPRSIFAVNRPLYSEHLPTLNNEHYFWSLHQRKPLYSEHMCNKICACLWNKRKKRMQCTFWNGARPIHRWSIYHKSIRRMYEKKGAITMNSSRRIDWSHMKERRTSPFTILRWRGHADWNRTQAHRGNGAGQMIAPTSCSSSKTTAFSSRAAHSTVHRPERSQVGKDRRFS